MTKLKDFINKKDIKTELLKLKELGFSGFQNINTHADAYYFALPICDNFENPPTLQLVLDLDDENENNVMAWCGIDTLGTGIIVGGVDFDVFISTYDALTADNIINKALESLNSSTYQGDRDIAKVKSKTKFQHKQIQKFAEAVIPIMNLIQEKSFPKAA